MNKTAPKPKGIQPFPVRFPHSRLFPKITGHKLLPPENERQSPVFSFIAQILKGLGQIMLQEHVATGLLFLSGIFYGSAVMGLAALLATFCGTLTARILKFDPAAIDKGLYGFNAALTGVALMLFFKPVLIVWMLVLAAAVATTALQHYFMSKELPVFTLPFVLVTWLLLFTAGNYFPGLLQNPQAPAASLYAPFDFALKGYGQVIFQGSLWAGILFFIAVFMASPVAALYGLAGGMLSGLLAQYLSVPVEEVAGGLFSFNAVLCAIVFAGNSVRDGCWALLSVLLSLAFSLFLVHYGFVQLTFPFVAASFIVVWIKKRWTAQGS